MLVYAQDENERESVTYTVRHSGKRLEVAALDLSGTLDGVLAQVAKLACKVRALRGKARQVRRAA